jgi:hypothetical protein
MQKLMEKYPYATLLLFLFIAYLPVSSFQFAVKNDFFTGYFPPKFFLSESLSNGVIPFWNPYINYGIPAYGDMSSGYWSPFTWLIALAGYNAYSFTVELLASLFIGATGIYLAGRQAGIKKPAALFGAASYLCCGYMIGNLQHFNWVAGAAWIPWCLVTFYRLAGSFSVKRGVACLMAFYLFATSAHPGLIIGCFYFFTLGILVYGLKGNDTYSGWQKKLLPSGLIVALALPLICAGMIYAYTDALPHLTRGFAAPAPSATGATSMENWITLLLPVSAGSLSGWSGNDISMRNVYTGIPVFAGFLALFIPGTNKRKYGLLAIILFFLLLSAGVFSSVPVLKATPLLDLVRLPGEFRIFALLPVILSGMYMLNRLFDGEEKVLTAYVKILNLFASILSVLFLVFLFSWLKHPGNGPGHLEWSRVGIKHFFYSLSPALLTAAQAFLFLLFCMAYLFLVRKKMWVPFFLVFLTELTLATWTNMPYTGAGKTSVSEIQQLISQSPAGFPPPGNRTAATVCREYPQTDSLIGNWSLYGKTVALDRQVPYPAGLKSTEALFDSGVNDSLLSRPFLFTISKNDDNAVSVAEFKPGLVRIRSELSEHADLVIKQAFYPRWKGEVQEKTAVEVRNWNGLLRATLPSGAQDATFRFAAQDISMALIFHFTVFLVLAIAWSTLHAVKKSS